MSPIKRLLPFLLLLSSWLAAPAAETRPPVQLAIVGLVHDHVWGMLPALEGRTDIVLAGIVEPDQALCHQIAERFHLEAGLFYPTLEALRAQRKIDAVALFTSTYDHRQWVEACAPLGLPVMMEKPMAVSLADARAMAAAAQKGGIPLVVNFETTWYASNHAAYDLVRRQNALGDLRKLVIRDGHSGPAAICSPFFLNWLTDPVLNGGGALMDFGCYGANLSTWLMAGQRPTSVFAVTQHLQPDVYPKVDDEATIVLTYPRAQTIIQASWNWPQGRKDMDLYGTTGALRVPDRNSLFLRQGNASEAAAPVPKLAAPEDDMLTYFVAVTRGEAKSTGLSSPELNVIVAEILDAARESARTGRRIDLPAIPASN
jgi:predicted dehydrogenase